MTLDMKRLCAAARSVLEEAETSRPTPGGSEVMIDMEVIVRAVLMELREVSDEMRIGMLRGRYVQRPPTEDEEFTRVGRRMMTAETGFASMIDHILAEPATA